MKKNRKRSKKMSVMASRSMHVGGVLVMFFVMVIVNLLASSSCTQLMKSIGERSASSQGWRTTASAKARAGTP